MTTIDHDPDVVLAVDGSTEAAPVDERPLASPVPDRKRHERRSAILVKALQAAILGGALGLWEIAATHGWIDLRFTSRPSDIWDAAFEFYDSGRFAVSTIATVKAVTLAFVIGTVSGTVVGFFLGLRPLADRVLGPFLVPLNSVPRLALAPMFILWFGLTMSAKVWLAVSIVFFVLVVNSRAAVKGIDSDLLIMGRVVGFTRRQLLAKIVWPGSVPAVFAGVRLAITYALLGVIGSEMIASRDGLGQDVMFFANTLNTAGMFAVILELVLLSTVISITFERLERVLLRWQQP